MLARSRPRSAGSSRAARRSCGQECQRRRATRWRCYDVDKFRQVAAKMKQAEHPVQTPVATRRFGYLHGLQHD